MLENIHVDISCCETFIYRYIQRFLSLDLNVFVDKNECEVSPCQNNGTCINNDGSYSCDCSAGWTGHDCETGLFICNSFTKKKLRS